MASPNRLPREGRPPDDMDAWILGIGVPSLSAAVHLIEEAKIPAANIHILETFSKAGGSTAHAGDPVNGYQYRAEPIPAFDGHCLQDTLSMVPSKTRAGKSAFDDIREFNEAEGLDGTSHTRFLVEKGRGVACINPRHVSLRLQDRISLTRFTAKTEQSLGRSRIHHHFSEGFFGSNYWLMLATTVGFQPWHSAAEFHRYIGRFKHDIYETIDPRPLDRGQFNRHEAITAPIARFLESQGVDFRFRTRVTDIIIDHCNGSQRVSAIQCAKVDEPEVTIPLRQNDIVITSLGSVMSGPTTGTNTSAPPPPGSIDTENGLDENWLLWLQLCTKSPKFGNAYNFCTRMPESCLETFTATMKTPEFFDRFIALTHDQPRAAVLVTLKDSSWLLSLSVPQQPLFEGQPSDVQVFWGYALRPDQEGDFVKKPMLDCSGEEIMIEVLGHLKFPLELLHQSTTIPCIVPRMTAALLPRATSDRPPVIPEGITNLALIGQFVEIENEMVATLDYGVRGAQMAVYHLMGLQQSPKEQPKPVDFEI